jgi:hypothetical protein
MQISAGRIAIGLSLVAAPQIVGGMWIGNDGRRAAVSVIGRAVGARDTVLGAGTLNAIRSNQPVRPWVLAGLVADATDLLATYAARHHLPKASAPMIYALAGGALVAGAANLASGDDSAQPQPTA